MLDQRHEPPFDMHRQHVRQRAGRVDHSEREQCGQRKRLQCNANLDRAIVDCKQSRFGDVRRCAAGYVGVDRRVGEAEEMLVAKFIRISCAIVTHWANHIRNRATQASAPHTWKRQCRLVDWHAGEPQHLKRRLTVHLAQQCFVDDVSKRNQSDQRVNRIDARFDIAARRRDAETQQKADAIAMSVSQCSSEWRVALCRSVIDIGTSSDQSAHHLETAHFGRDKQRRFATLSPVTCRKHRGNVDGNTAARQPAHHFDVSTRAP